MVPGAVGGLDALDIELGARAALVLVEACADLGLRCVDVPIVTTGLLEAAGAGQYRVRRFWAHARRASGLELVLYKWRGTVFRLRLEHREGPLYEVLWSGVRVPLDPEEVPEAEARGLEIGFAPRSHMLLLSLEGVHEGRVVVSMGVPRLLLLVYRLSPRGRELVRGLVECVVEAAWGRPSCLAEAALGLAREWGSLGLVLPRVPRSREDLERLSPLLRRLLSPG